MERGLWILLLVSTPALACRCKCTPLRGYSTSGVIYELRKTLFDLFLLLELAHVQVVIKTLLRK